MSNEALKPMPHQMDGVKFCMGREGSLIACDQGTGKTGMACLSMIAWTQLGECLAKESSVLIVCPATLKLNWKREIEAWWESSIIAGDVPEIGIASGKVWPDAPVIIANYDILEGHQKEIEAIEWDLVILDEAHAIKNRSAMRSKMICGGRQMEKVVEKVTIGGKQVEKKRNRVKRVFAGVRAKRRIAMTGTPILNAPVEIYNQLRWLQPGKWDNYNWFIERFCDAAPGYSGRLEPRGASNLDELNRRLKSVVFRVLKKDVLKDLPPKMRQIIPLPAPQSIQATLDAQINEWRLAAPAIQELQERRKAAKVASNQEEYEAIGEQLSGARNATLSKMSEMRKAIGVSKIPVAVHHIKDSLDAGGKVVVFAHHKEVLHTLAAELESFGVAFIDGDVELEDRQSAVDRFQTDPNCRVAVLSILAAGVGITLTASSHVIMVESDWRPGINSQAEDRCHRIGQKDSVLVQHLVYDGSLDASIIKKCIEKQKIIDSAIDGRTFVKPSPGRTEIERDLEAAAGNATSHKQAQKAVRAMSLLSNPALSRHISPVHASDIRRINEIENLNAKQIGVAMMIASKYRHLLPFSVRIELFS